MTRALVNTHAKQTFSFWVIVSIILSLSLTHTILPYLYSTICVLLSFCCGGGGVCVWFFDALPIFYDHNNALRAVALRFGFRESGFHRTPVYFHKSVCLCVHIVSFCVVSYAMLRLNFAMACVSLFYLFFRIFHYYCFYCCYCRRRRYYIVLWKWLSQRLFSASLFYNSFIWLLLLFLCSFAFLSGCFFFRILSLFLIIMCVCLCICVVRRGGRCFRLSEIICLLKSYRTRTRAARSFARSLYFSIE